MGVGKVVLGIGIGTVAMDLLFRAAFGYDVWLRYTRAMASHAEFMHWRPGLANVARAAAYGYTEFLFYFGAALVVLCVSGFVRTVRHAAAGRMEPLDRLGLVVFALFLLLGVTSRTHHETARLWAFLSPVLCILVVREVRLHWRRGAERGLMFVVLLQLVTCLLVWRY